MIKIALDSYPFIFKKEIGPTIFLKRLSKKLISFDCKLVTKYNYNYDVALFLIKNKSIYKKPYVLRIGGIYFDKNNTISNTEKENNEIFKSIENSTGVVFISEFTKKLVLKFYPNFNKPNLVINNSVPLEIFRPEGSNKRSELGINKNDFVIVVSASWRRHKRLHEVIKFFSLIKKKISNVKLLVLGENTDVKSENQSIFFAGKIKPEMLPDWYRTGNLYMHIAWIEQNANTQVEAIACGLPSICSNNGGNRETLEKCNAGIISETDEYYKFDKIDFYNPPEPNYDNLIKDFLKIYNNYEYFKSKIKFKEIDLNYAAKRYFDFLKLCSVMSKKNEI
jgi:glycosyltransferase involved in cell wall biosynthesis